MWIIYPKIIFACVWLADLSPNCSTLSVLLNFKNTSHRFYNNQWPSILINSNKIFEFLLCFKGIQCNKLEIDFNIGGRRLGPLDLVTHPDTNPVQQSLTFVNRREPVFSKGNSHQLFCHISFSKEEQFSSKFFEESFFCVPNYIIISLQVTSPRTMKTTSLTSNCLQSFIPKQVSQSTGQDLVAFQVHPDIPRKVQQYFKFDRPSSLIQQEKPPGHKFTLAQGLVTCAQAIGRGRKS